MSYCKKLKIFIRIPKIIFIRFAIIKPNQSSKRMYPKSVLMSMKEHSQSGIEFCGFLPLEDAVNIWLKPKQLMYCRIPPTKWQLPKSTSSLMLCHGHFLRAQLAAQCSRPHYSNTRTFLPRVVISQHLRQRRGGGAYFQEITEVPQQPFVINTKQTADKWTRAMTPIMAPTAPAASSLAFKEYGAQSGEVWYVNGSP